jgi:uncharacterized protein YuzE
MSKILSFNVTYDAGADVLYITRRRDVAVRGIEDENGIVWRYDLVGEVLSATVMDFREIWETKQHELAGELSRGFHIPDNQAEVVISYALNEGRAH